jgi:hypothetical protein
MTSASMASLERRAHVDAREGLRGEPLGGLIITRTARSEALIVRGTGYDVDNPPARRASRRTTRRSAALPGSATVEQRTTNHKAPYAPIQKTPSREDLLCKTPRVLQRVRSSGPPRSSAARTASENERTTSSFAPVRGLCGHYPALTLFCMDNTYRVRGWQCTMAGGPRPRADRGAARRHLAHDVPAGEEAGLRVGGLRAAGALARQPEVHVVRGRRARRLERRRARTALPGQHDLAVGESAIKRPSPLNVLKYTYDHGCY